MRSEERVHVGLPKSVFSLGVALGVPAERLEQGAGLRSGALEEPDARLPYGALQALWATLVAECPSEPLGLRLAEHMRVAHLGLVGALVRRSTHLGEALTRTLQFQRLLDPRLDWSMQPSHGTGTEVQLEHEPWMSRLKHPMEGLLLTGLALARALVQAPVRPRVLRFHHSHHAHAAAVEAFVGAPVEWDAEVDAIVLGEEVLALPVLHADPPVGEALEHHARHALAAVEGGRAAGEDSFASRVRDALLSALREGGLREDGVARRLAVSRRTLQRRLQEEGTSFGVLADGVRRASALRLLEDPRVSVAEVAFLLGFSEPSTFHRAFRRWTGAAPVEWRRARGA